MEKSIIIRAFLRNLKNVKGRKKMLLNKRNSGLIFVAYQGEKISFWDIEEVLKKQTPRFYTVKSAINAIWKAPKEPQGGVSMFDVPYPPTWGPYDVVFSKIVSNYKFGLREPDSVCPNRFTVSGYHSNELSKAQRHFGYHINEPICDHHMLTMMYGNYGPSIFKELGRYMHFCSVIYDVKRETLVAGVTKPKGKYTHLYYGYTTKEHAVMYSNSAEVLLHFCDFIEELPENTYMESSTLYGTVKFYHLDGEEIVRIPWEQNKESWQENFNSNINASKFNRENKKQLLSNMKKSLQKMNSENQMDERGKSKVR